MEQELENTQEQYDKEYEEAFFGEESEVAEEVPTEEVIETTEEVEAPLEEEVVEAPLESDEAVDDEEVTEESEEDSDGQEEVAEEAEDEEKFAIKWNGEDISVTKDELIALGQKGFDYTSKMQNVSKYRKDLESAGITDEVLDLMKQVQTGDKTALARLAQMNNIDALDLLDVDLEENDTTTPLKNPSEIVLSKEVAPLMEQIRSNPSLLSKMDRAEGLLPNAVISRMANDADLLYGAVSEVESGSFDQVMPRVNVRLASLSDLDREYVLNSPEVFGNLYMEEKSNLSGVEPQAREPQQAKRNKPNMAEVGIKKSNKTTRTSDVIKDAFSDTDEYQKILDRLANSR